MNNKLCDIHQYDARKIDELIKEPIVDVTVTSPPYFDMKDYGYKEQIGFGQSYKEYLDDIGTVFRSIYACTKSTGSLWVIVDALRKDGEIIALPFDIANKIKEAGWIFREIIIWEKDKTVPWTHKGQMRNSFEYILMFSKTDDYKFFIDKIRDYEVLKSWWIRYPERYNPKGKTPDGIWHYPIPTQGSWGNGYIRHFCPLPEDLVARILTLSTEEKDVVLDPFSGSGTVLAKALNMNRRYIGTELNSEYISMFKNYIKNTNTKKHSEYEKEKKYLVNQMDFEKIILQLRALKYARILLKKIGDQDAMIVQKIKVEKSSEKRLKKNSVDSYMYTILLSTLEEKEKIEKIINALISKAPLSKFGINALFSYVDKIDKLISPGEKLYSYSVKITHKFIREVSLGDQISDKEVILSPIKLNIDENEYKEL